MYSVSSPPSGPASPLPRPIAFYVFVLVSPPHQCNLNLHENCVVIDIDDIAAALTGCAPFAFTPDNVRYSAPIMNRSGNVIPPPPPPPPSAPVVTWWGLGTRLVK